MVDQKLEIITLTPGHSDARGHIVNLHESARPYFNRPISHIAYYTSKGGCIRGNHFHPHHDEVIFLIQGKYQLFTKELDTDEKDEKIIQAGQIVICRANLVHALRHLEDSLAIAISDGGKDQKDFSDHTRAYKLIE